MVAPVTSGCSHQKINLQDLLNHAVVEAGNFKQSKKYVKAGKPFLLEATLSLRNSDPKEDIAFVHYDDTNGKLIKDYLEKPMLLKSLAKAEFLVAQKEIEGASGANLLIEWISDTSGK